MQNKNNGNWVTKSATLNRDARLIFGVKIAKTRVNKTLTIELQQNNELE